MSVPMLNFLPGTVRREVRYRRARRRTVLLMGLMLALSVGAGLHSWNSARHASAVRRVSTQLAENADDQALSETEQRLSSEAADLERALQVTDGLVPTISTSTVIATISHLLPEQVSLQGVRIEFEEAPRQFQILLKGCASSGDILGDFERKLASCPVFSGVTLSERRTVEWLGRRVDEFTVSLQVPLDVQLRAPATLRVASGGIQ